MVIFSSCWLESVRIRHWKTFIWEAVFLPSIFFFSFFLLGSCQSLYHQLNSCIFQFSRILWPVDVVGDLTPIWRHFYISLLPLSSCYHSSGIGFAYLAFLAIYSLCSRAKDLAFVLVFLLDCFFWVFFFFSCVLGQVMTWEVFESSSGCCGTDFYFLLFISWSCQYNSTVFCWVIWWVWGLFPWTGDWVYSPVFKKGAHVFF